MYILCIPKNILWNPLRSGGGVGWVGSVGAPAESKVANKLHEIPPMWYKGKALRHTSCSPSFIVVAMLRAPLMSWPVSRLRDTCAYIYIYIYTYVCMCVCKTEKQLYMFLGKISIYIYIIFIYLYLSLYLSINKYIYHYTYEGKEKVTVLSWPGPPSHYTYIYIFNT